jgi:hypothetical protein
MAILINSDWTAKAYKCKAIMTRGGQKTPRAGNKTNQGVLGTPKGPSRLDPSLRLQSSHDRSQQYL